jgi:hypothetical protein
MTMIIALTLLMILLTAIGPRRLYWGTEAWSHRDPHAVEPSDTAYAVQRFLFGAIAAAGVFAIATTAFNAATSETDEQRAEAAATEQAFWPRRNHTGYPTAGFNDSEIQPCKMLAHALPHGSSNAPLIEAAGARIGIERLDPNSNVGAHWTLQIDGYDTATIEASPHNGVRVAVYDNDPKQRFLRFEKRFPITPSLSAAQRRLAVLKVPQSGRGSCCAADRNESTRWKHSSSNAMTSRNGSTISRLRTVQLHA